MSGKIIFSVVIFLISALSSAAQNKVIKHCYVFGQYGAFSKTKFKITLQKGNVDSLFSFANPAVVKELYGVEKTETLADAMNYMEMHGWKSTAIVFSQMYDLHELFFEREFDAAEVNKK